jgi:chaperonin GroEL (HSP60 family)
MRLGSRLLAVGWHDASFNGREPRQQGFTADRVQELAVGAVRRVMRVIDGSRREVDIKKYAKVEKIPGGSVQDCTVMDGVMFNKDVVNPDRMKRSVKDPRILLLDCPLEYKKGENQTAVELVSGTDFAELLKQEEEVRLSCHCLLVVFDGHRCLLMVLDAHVCASIKRE